MKKLLLMVGAAALASTPALADAKAAGPKGKANPAAKVQKMKAGKAQKMVVDRRGAVDRNRNGIADWNERWLDRGNYGGNVCPPGLANRVPPCVPPGQAVRLGGVVPSQWGVIDWDNIPLPVRQRYVLDDDWRYTYYGRRLYVVDPVTNVITRIINGVVF